MEKDLPIVEIAGEVYEVDVMKGQLTRVNDRESTIEIANLHYTDAHYLLNYSWGHGKVGPNGKPLEIKRGQAIIPHMSVLDPQAMAVKYGKVVSEVIGTTDFEIIVNQEQYNSRLSGKLPTIEIMGKPFEIDVANGALKPLGQPDGKDILFKDMVPMPLDGPKCYRFAYDPENACEIRCVPEDKRSDSIYLIEIASIEKLDPFGFAELLKQDIKDFLIKYPIQEKLEATVVAWKKIEPMKVTDADRKRVAKLLDDEADAMEKRPRIKLRKGKRF